MPLYVFKCVNEQCLVNLPESDDRIARVSAALGHAVDTTGVCGEKTIEVAYPSYSSMRADESEGNPKCSICKQPMKRGVTAPRFGTTRDTTAAKRNIDCVVGASAERQWESIRVDRDLFGGDKGSEQRKREFAAENAKAKKQAVELASKNAFKLRGAQ